MIELLVVISVVGILSTILIAKIDPLSQINKAKDAQRQQDLQSLKLSLDTYLNDKKCYPLSLTELSTGDKPYITYVTEGNCPQWYSLFAKLRSSQTNVATGKNCSLPTTCGSTLPSGLVDSDPTWVCKTSGVVNCGYLASNVTLNPNGSVSVPSTPTPMITGTSASPTPTPTLIPANCADGSVDQAYSLSLGTMVGCWSSSGGNTINFSQAAPLCGTGSHICSLDEYLNRGGNNFPTVSGELWLDTRQIGRAFQCPSNSFGLTRVDFDSGYSFSTGGACNVSINSCGSTACVNGSSNIATLRGAVCCSSSTFSISSTPTPTPTPDTSVYVAYDAIDPEQCLTGYEDKDNDGFTAGAPRTFCGVASLPSTYKKTKSLSEDCYDNNVDAYPTQTKFFGTDRGDGSFDYNCDGVQEIKKPCSDASLAVNANPAQTKPGIGSDYMTWCSGSVTRDNALSLCQTTNTDNTADTILCPVDYYGGYFVGGASNYWLGVWNYSGSGGSYVVSGGTTGWCGCPAGNPGCTVDEVPQNQTWCPPWQAGGCKFGYPQTIVRGGSFQPMTSDSNYGFVTSNNQSYVNYGNSCSFGPFTSNFYYFNLQQKDTPSGSLCCSKVPTIGR